MADDKNDKPMSALERYLAKQKAEKARAQQSAAAPPAKDKSRLFARAEAQAQAYADSKSRLAERAGQKATPNDPRAKSPYGPGERPTLAGIERPEPVQPPTLSRWESVAESRLSESEQRARDAGAPAPPPSRESQTVYTPVEPSPTETHAWAPVDEWRPITDSTLAADGVQNAGFGIRVVATLIDGVIVAFLNGVAQRTLTPVLGLTMGSRSFEGLSYLIYFAVIYAYYGYFYSVKGASPGKMLLGLEVTSLDGVTRLSPWRAFVREAIGKFISAIPLGMGYVIVMIRLDHRALHDLLFDTRVVRKKGGA